MFDIFVEQPILLASATKRPTHQAIQSGSACFVAKIDGFTDGGDLWQRQEHLLVWGEGFLLAITPAVSTDTIASRRIPAPKPGLLPLAVHWPDLGRPPN